MKKLLVVLLAFIFNAHIASAHVVVKPAEVGIGTFQTFTVGVPNEKENPTVGIRLEIPNGLNYVTPNVKSGWKVDTKKTGKGDEAAVTEIMWTGGEVPAGQRDDFAFSTQVPSEETTVIWKAYQTYQDGTVVEWIHEPSADHEESDPPYSQTKVVNDIASDSSAPQAVGSAQTKPTLDSIVAYAALVLAAVSLGVSIRKKK